MKHTKVQSENMLLIPPADIFVDWAKNSREEKPSLTALENSIEQIGQQFPVLVKQNVDETYNVIAGFCRVEAIKNLAARNPDKAYVVKALVIEGTDESYFLTNLHENLVRENFSPVDSARAVIRLIRDYGKSVAEAAALVGKTTVWVRQCQKLLKLDSVTLAMVHRGEITRVAGIMLSELTPEERRKALAKADILSAVVESEQKAKKAAKAPKASAPVANEELSGAVESAVNRTAPIPSRVITKAIQETQPAAKGLSADMRGMRELLEVLNSPGEISDIRKPAGILLDFISGKCTAEKAADRIRKYFLKSE